MAMAWGWACTLPAMAHPAAAPSLSPVACTLQPDELAFEWCDLLRQAESACAAVEPAHRAHCLDCWLANHRVPCAHLGGDAAARCRRVALDLRRCAEGSHHTTCLTRSLRRHLLLFNPGAQP
jgi:hypothetical protein